MNTGIADNGDFDRSINWLLEKPTGFSLDVPPLDSPEYTERYFNRWHPDWEYKGHIEWAPYTVTSYQLLLLLGVLVNKIAGIPHYSLIAAGLISRLLLLATILLLAKYLFGRGWPLWAAAITFIFLDSWYIAFLDYLLSGARRHPLFFLLLLTLARVARGGQGSDIALLSLALLLFSTAKTQLIFTPLVLLAAWVFTYGFGHSQTKRITLALLGVQLLASPLLLDNRFSARNHFNALFNGALLFDRSYFPAWLQPEMQECVGVLAWSRDPDCFARLETGIGMRQIGEVYKNNPLSLFKGFDYGLRSLNRIDLDKHYSLETKAVDTFQQAVVVNLWNRTKRLAAGFPVYLELGFIVALLFLHRRAAPHLSFLCLFLVGFIFSQVGVSILGEGKVRHWKAPPPRQCRSGCRGYPFAFPPVSHDSGNND